MKFILDFGKKPWKLKENYRKLLMDQFLYLYERLVKTWAAKPKLHVLYFKILMYVTKELQCTFTISFVKFFNFCKIMSYLKTTGILRINQNSFEMKKELIL